MKPLPIMHGSDPARQAPRGSILSRGIVQQDRGEYPVSERETAIARGVPGSLVASNVIRWERGLVPRAAFPDFMDGKVINIVPQPAVTARLGYRGDLPLALQPIVRKPWPWTRRVVR